MTLAIVGSIVGLITLGLVWLFSGFALTGLDDLDAPKLVIQLRRVTVLALPVTIILAIVALWYAVLTNTPQVRYLAVLPVLTLLLHIAMALAFPTDHSTPRLLENVDHANPILRKQAIQLLMFRSTPAEHIVSKAIDRLRNDPDARVRLAAAMLLMNHEHANRDSVERALHNALSDSDEQVRNTARLGVDAVRNRRAGRPGALPSTASLQDGA